MAHLHYCDVCDTAIRCTAPIIHEDSGSHCANYGPGEPVICAECAGEDDEPEYAGTVDEMRSTLANGLRAASAVGSERR